MVEAVRGLVRPAVTFMVILALVICVIYLVLKFADVELAKIFIAGFMTLVGSITGFWFGQRTTTTTS